MRLLASYLAIIGPQIFVSALPKPHPIPPLPVTFKGNVQFSSPIGPQKGYYYYDYPNSVERIDQTVWGQQYVMINDYVNNKTYNAQGPTGGWTCKVSDLNAELWESTIPPDSSYMGNQTIDGVDTELWEFNGLGLVDLKYYVAYNPGAKALSQLIRQVSSVVGIKLQLDFSNVIPGQLDPQTFNATQFGCPPPLPPVTFSVSGYALDATTGGIIAGASIKLSGTYDYSATTDSNGRYTIGGVAPGEYTYSASASGYIATSKTLTVSTDIPAGGMGDAYLSPKLPSGAWRAVLSWAAVPPDMDSHLLGPNCEVIYYNRQCSYGGSVTASLDHDVTNGYGPETITIAQVGSCSGSDCVLNYQAYMYSFVSGGLKESSCTVELYNEDGLHSTFKLDASKVPSASCRTWNVFSIDTSQSDAVTAVNTFSGC